MAVVQASGIDPLDQKVMRNWLKREHGILQNSQWTMIYEAEISEEVEKLLRIAYEQNG
ncbi:hypothetical protein [Candidatus Leptofilum sp.]|uniref:hypothetical protein n=1 Tax=Candidatus Leptofilum sp. TaxID=3241576 RepID=UPI003B59FFA3